MRIPCHAFVVPDEADIYKLLCHYLKVTQHHMTPRLGKFKAVAICYLAVAVLDGVAEEGKSVGDLILALCHAFLTIDWRRLKIEISAAGQIEICDKGDHKSPVCIMVVDGTNASHNVTGAQ